MGSEQQPGNDGESPVPVTAETQQYPSGACGGAAGQMHGAGFVHP